MGSELKDKVDATNSILNRVGSNIQYNLTINSGLFILRKSVGNSDKDTLDLDNIVLCTSNYSECNKYVSLLLDIIETVGSFLK